MASPRYRTDSLKGSSKRPTDYIHPKTSDRTIQAHEVDGLDYIFQHPKGTGNPFFVIRCKQAITLFENNPFHCNRAVKHFQTGNNHKCHHSRLNGNYTNDEIIRRFGYRGKAYPYNYSIPTTPTLDSPSPLSVVLQDGEDVDQDWVDLSNSALAERLKKNKRTKSRASSRTKTAGPKAKPKPVTKSAPKTKAQAANNARRKIIRPIGPQENINRPNRSAALAAAAAAAVARAASPSGTAASATTATTASNPPGAMSPADMAVVDPQLQRDGQHAELPPVTSDLLG